MRANVVANTVAGLRAGAPGRAGLPALPAPAHGGRAEPRRSAAGSRPPTAQTAGSLRVAQQAVPDLRVGKLLPSLQIEAQRLTLKQQALATTRITWNDRSTQYTTVIAVLAVALFLVGFGLIVEGPIRRSAYVLGLAVGIFAAAWGVWIYFLPIPSTPEAAIDGRRPRRGAERERRLPRRDRAVRPRARAPTTRYAAAYAGRSRARLLAANPDYAVTRAVTDASGTRRSGSRARRASGRSSSTAATSSASPSLAVTSFYRGDYDGGVDAADEAIAINPKVPDVWLLKSAAAGRARRPGGASASLDRALALLRGTAPSQRTRLLASTYLSYLAWVERHVPRRPRAARRLADRLVAIETAFTLGRTLPRAAPGAGHRRPCSGLRYADGKLMLRLRWTNLPAGDRAQRARLRAAARSAAPGRSPPTSRCSPPSAGSGERDISVAAAAGLQADRACASTST